MNAGFKIEDFMIVPGPSNNGKPVFLLNADAFIFWQRKEADLQAGQKLMAELVMDPAIQTMYSQITGSIPVRTDVDLNGPGWTDGQRTTAKALKDAMAGDRIVRREWRNAHGAFASDQDQIVSPEAYVQGLVWQAIDAHPRSAKPPGFGTWAFPPNVPSEIKP